MSASKNISNEHQLHSNQVVSSSSEEWIMLNANVKEQGIDLLAYGKTESHKHKVDGDSVMSIDLNEFFKIINIKRFFSYSQNGKDYLYFLLSEDTDDISYQLAVVKNNIQDQKEEFNPEIRYALDESFDRSLVPADAVEYTRG